MMLFTLQRYEFFSKSQQGRTNRDKLYRCCLPYKGTNFSANHNDILICEQVFHDVVYPTKVRIFSKSQQLAQVGSPTARCCLPYKGTNFSANHNAHPPLLNT